MRSCASIQLGTDLETDQVARYEIAFRSFIFRTQQYQTKILMDKKDFIWLHLGWESAVSPSSEFVINFSDCFLLST